MISPDRKTQEAELKIGEMPRPRYIPIKGGERLIGMEAYSPDRKIKEFLWWENGIVQQGDLNNATTRHEAAALVTRLRLELGVDAAIGLPIDLEGSKPKTGFVKIVKNPELVGIYIEAGNRLGFNFLVARKGLKTELELRLVTPVLFDEIFQKAKAVLPYPEPSFASEAKS